MKIPPCKICGVSLKFQGGKILSIAANKLTDYTPWQDRRPMDAANWNSGKDRAMLIDSRMVEYGEERWNEIG